MTAAAFALAGVIALAFALIVLRSVGPGFRVGRLLAGTTAVSIDEAIRLAETSASRYVKVSGRITSDEEFPDEQDRPLVFRRTRLFVGPGRGRVVLDEREAVPFAVETRSSAMGVDEAAIDEGIVVIPRESAGRVGDLPPSLSSEIPPGTAADVPALLQIEQLSAVEHATVCGVPVQRDGRPTMTKGASRPLIVTTLDAAAAMRLLARDGRTRVTLATALLVAGFALLVAAGVALIVGA